MSDFNRERSYIGLLASLAGSLLLAIITAVVFYFGLLPTLTSIYPYVIAFALLVIVLVVVLVAVSSGRRHSGITDCLCRTGYVTGAALATFVIFLIALSITLVVGSLVSALLVFIGAFVFWFLVFSFGMLLACLVSAGCCKCGDGCECHSDDR